MVTVSRRWELAVLPKLGPHRARHVGRWVEHLRAPWLSDFYKKGLNKLMGVLPTPATQPVREGGSCHSDDDKNIRSDCDWPEKHDISRLFYLPCFALLSLESTNRGTILITCCHRRAWWEMMFPFCLWFLMFLIVLFCFFHFQLWLAVFFLIIFFSFWIF